MFENDRYLLAVQLHNPEQFCQIFGSAVVQLAHIDLTRGIEILCEPLLRRYQYLSDLISEDFGRWHRLFGLKDSLMVLDMEEQVPVLQEIGAAKFRELLIRCFGPATGSRLEFSFLIAKAPEHFDADSIRRVIDQTPGSSSGSDLVGTDARELVQRLIDCRELISYFQPIVSLPDETIVGYEALSRGPADSRLHSADHLFTAARHAGLTNELELASLKQAIGYLRYIPEPLWISVNLGPDLLLSSEFGHYLLDSAVWPLIPRVVFELTEHLPVESAVRLRKTVAQFRNGGIRLSLDDTGCGFFDLSTVEELRPEIVKLCITVISRIGRSPEIEQEMRSTIRTISASGGITLGEGVENVYQAEVLTRCGATLAQGYFFGLPKPASEMFGS
ncbi:MAG: EAL domain-containing protein [Gammaproteobacteria bacterium]